MNMQRFRQGLLKRVRAKFLFLAREQATADLYDKIIAFEAKPSLDPDLNAALTTFASDWLATVAVDGRDYICRLAVGSILTELNGQPHASENLTAEIVEMLVQCATDLTRNDQGAFVPGSEDCVVCAHNWENVAANILKRVHASANLTADEMVERFMQACQGETRFTANMEERVRICALKLVDAARRSSKV